MKIKFINIVIGFFFLIPIGILMLLLLPFLIFLFPLYLNERKIIVNKSQKKFHILEGSRVFVYNENKKPLSFIEKEVLRKLPKNIKVLKVKNGEIINSKDVEYYSSLFFEIKNCSIFPIMIKIKNGEVKRVSMNNELFRWKNQSKNPGPFFIKLCTFFELKN